MINMLGIEYDRGATANIVDRGPSSAPRAIQKMFPNACWTIVTPPQVSKDVCMADRFGDAYTVHKQIFSVTPKHKHICCGGDHSINFGHFAAVADQYPNEDLCLVYIDAHLDIHTPESSKTEATGSPHGTNVRHLLGEGDSRWLGLQTKHPALKPENLFYFGSRSYEPSEIKFVEDNNIFCKKSAELQTVENVKDAVSQVLNRIGNKKFVVSVDFDGLDPKYFSDVLVPEPNGLSLDTVKYIIQSFSNAISFEFVEYACLGDKNSADTVKNLISLVTPKFDINE